MCFYSKITSTSTLNNDSHHEPNKLNYWFSVNVAKLNEEKFVTKLTMFKYYCACFVFFVAENEQCFINRQSVYCLLVSSDPIGPEWEQNVDDVGWLPFCNKIALQTFCEILFKLRRFCNGKRRGKTMQILQKTCKVSLSRLRLLFVSTL